MVTRYPRGVDDPLGRTLVGVQAFLFVALAWGPSVGPSPAWLAPGWAALGVGLLLCGAVLAVLAGVRLGTGLTPFPRPRPGRGLITDGVYRLVRHPIYGGVLLMALGWTLVHPMPATLLGTSLLWLLFEVKSRYEERLLCTVHPEYDTYRRGRRRFVPFLY